MIDPDDALGLRLLGQVQELRAALERLNNREEARALKAKLLAFHEASHECDLEDVGRIVDEFFTMAKGRIVKTYGTAAWDEPETVEEARARMGTLPAAPGPGVLDRVNAREPAPPPLTDADMDEIQRKWGTGSVNVESAYADTCRLISEVRRLRSDEWLEKAAREIGLQVDSLSTWAPKQEDCWQDIIEILRKHRGGKA